MLTPSIEWWHHADVFMPYFALAQRTLNISTADATERATYLQRLYSYQPNAHTVHCSKAWHGVNVVYVQIYKSNTQSICTNLRLLRGGHDFPSHAGGEAFEQTRGDLPTVAFTFVREPLDHLVSAYSEMEYRIRADRAPWRRPEHAARRGRTEEEIASHFIHELIACHGRTVSDEYTLAQHDAHAAPQIAFVRSGLAGLGLPRLNFVGRLENMSSDWHALGKLVMRHVNRQVHEHVTWPEYITTANKHVHTDQASANPPRTALERVLLHDRELTLATCLVLLPDYVCFDIDMLPRHAAVPNSHAAAACGIAIGIPHGALQLRKADLDLCAPAIAAPGAIGIQNISSLR